MFLKTRKSATSLGNIHRPHLLLNHLLVDFTIYFEQYKLLTSASSSRQPNLPRLGKTLKCVILNHLSTFLTQKNLLYFHQSAFIAGLSTETVLLSTSKALHFVWKASLSLPQIFLDLSTVLDTIDSHILSSSHSHGPSWLFSDLWHQNAACGHLGKLPEHS